MKYEAEIIRLMSKEATQIGICIEEMSDVKIGEMEYFASSMLMSLDYWQPYHLYVTVGQDVENIKEGEWCIYKNSTDGKMRICQAYLDFNNNLVFDTNDDSYNRDIGEGITPLKTDIRKIIATTDSKLTVDLGHLCLDQLPQVGQEFIKEYCANPVEKVMVEYDVLGYKRGNTRICIKGTDSCINLNDAGNKTMLRLKLNQDNTINISSIDDSVTEKMYSTSEVEMLIFKYAEDEHAWFSSKGECEQFNNWIKNNL